MNKVSFFCRIGLHRWESLSENQRQCKNCSRIEMLDDYGHWILTGVLHRGRMHMIYGGLVFLSCDRDQWGTEWIVEDQECRKVARIRFTSQGCIKWYVEYTYKVFYSKRFTRHSLRNPETQRKAFCEIAQSVIKQHHKNNYQIALYK